MEKKRAASDPMGTTVPPPSSMDLQEYAPLDNLLQMLPRKAQRGLTNINIEFTCVDANKEFIVLGSNIPIVFVYDRKEQQLIKLKSDDNKSCRIGCVRMLTCLDHQLAVGNTSGRVEVYLIPAKLPGHTKDVKKFVINGGHRGSITCAEWSTNGMKLFTGDTTGSVVYTEVDFYKNQCTPTMIVHEDNPVVQLNYAYKILIVSTYARTVLCYTDENYRIQQTGQQARKSKGNFGGHFIPAICKPKDAKLYASRPGLRLWKVNAEGQVLETIMYKELIKTPHKNIELLPDVGLALSIKPPTGDLQFGPTLMYKESYVLTWCQNFLAILDPTCLSGAAVLASSQGKVGSIVSVAVSEDEIFVLRRGAERSLVRIATHPEMQGIKEHMTFSPEELDRLQQLNVPNVIQDGKKDTQSNTSSKMTAFKKFFSKKADELSEDAARLSETIKEGALEIKQKAVGLKKDSKDEAKESETESEDVDKEDGHSSDEEESEDEGIPVETTGNTPTASVSNEILQSQFSNRSTDEDAVAAAESSTNDDKEEKQSTPSLLSALASGLQVAGIVAAGSPQEEDVSVQDTLEKRKTEEVNAIELDEENLKKIGEEKFDDVIVQPKRPMKKKKKKPKGARKKETTPDTNGNEMTNAENGNQATTSKHSDQLTENAIIGSDIESGLERTNMHTNLASADGNSPAPRDQIQQFLQQNEPQDVTITGSGAKSLVTPHGSVADRYQADIPTPEVIPVTLTNGNDDSIFGMVTALASSEPSKPRPEELLVGSYPGEVSEADLPGSLHSFPHDIGSNELPTQDNSGAVEPTEEDNIGELLVSDISDVNGSPVVVQAHSADSRQSMSNPPDQFPVEDILPKDSTEELMGDFDLNLPSAPSEDDFYSKYRAPTMLPDLTPKDKEDVTSSGESAEDVPIPENIQQKLAGSWMQCTVPGFITQLLVSDRNVWCVDNRDKIYHTLVNSVNYKWSRLKDSGMQIAVSPTESIVWRVHRRTNIAYASAPITPRSPVGSKWEQACRNVTHVCLDEKTAWIIKTDGNVYVHKNISKDRPYNKTIQVDSNMRIEYIAANREVVWGLTTDKMVVFRTDVSTLKPQGRLWRELTDSFRLRAVCIALDGRNNGWAIDEDGIVWFRTGVTSDTPQGDQEKWWQVPMGEYLMQDPNMMGMLLNMAGSTALDRVEKVTGQMTSWLKKLSPVYRATHLAASGAGVWVCGAHHYKSTMHVSKGNLLGSRWEQALPIGLPSSVIWSDVSAGGVHSNAGRIWSLQKGGEVFCFPPDTHKAHLVEPPVNVKFKQLSATPEAVWGLGDKGVIYIRIGVSERHPHGVVWKKLDISQLGNKKIVHICCGSNVVWACDHEGGMHFRIGVTMPLVEALPPAWVPVDGRPAGYGHWFTQIACGGPSDASVWAVDNRRNVYVRKGISENMPIGVEWESVEGTQALQVCISANSVWALCPNGDIACRFGVTDKNPIGDYWKKVPGNFAFLTGTQSDDLWAINSEGHLFQRFTKMFQRHQPGVMSSPDPDEWELL